MTDDLKIVPSGAPPQMTPEMTANIEKFRHAIQLGMGQIVLATMSLPRYPQPDAGPTSIISSSRRCCATASP